MIFALPTMCRASEGLKIEVFNYAYRNIWNKNQNSIAKKAQCWFLKFRMWNFDVSIGQLMLKKNNLVLSLENTPYFFFSKRWLSYVHFQFLASEAQHIGSIANWCGSKHRDLEQMEPILNFQVPAEGLELAIYLQIRDFFFKFCGLLTIS